MISILGFVCVQEVIIVMDITEISILHHVGIVLISLWLLSSFDCCHAAFYFLALIYLYLVRIHGFAFEIFDFIVLLLYVFLVIAFFD